MKRKPLASLILGGVEYFNDRAAFEEATGKQAPPFKAEENPQFWRASTTGPLKFQTIENGEYVDESVENAGAVNLPGRYDYPRFKAAPTEAYIVDRDVEKRLNPIFLCLPREAAQLSRELDAAGMANDLSEVTYYRGLKIIYPADEARRKFYISVGGESPCAATLWEVRNRHVGQTGEWKMGDFGPEFHPAKPVTSNALPAVPVPYRQVKDDERIVPAFGGWVVETGDPEPGGGAVDLSKVLDGQDRLASMLLELLERGEA